MAKVVLQVETDLGQAESAFAKSDNLVQGLRAEVVGLGKDSKTAMSVATKETDKFNNEVKEGTKQVDDLGHSVGNVGKAGNKIKDIKNEIKKLTSEAIIAGEGSKKFADNLARVGQLKDELNDISAAIKGVSGNLSENLAGAAGESISLIATGFEGATAASALFGLETENVEKQLLKLQAIKSLASVAKEFGGIGDKLAEIKLAFSPVTSGLKDLYTSGNAGLLRMKKEGLGGIISGLGSSLQGGLKAAGAGIKQFVVSGIAGMKTLGATIAANPFGLVLVAITAIITVMVLLKDKVKPIAAIFEFLGEIIDGITDSIHALGEALGLVASEFEEGLTAQIKGVEEVNKAIGKRYDFEIKKAQAAGKETEELEKEKALAQAKTIGQAIGNLEALRIINGKLNDEELKEQKKLQEELTDLRNEVVVATIKQQTELKKKEDDARKKREEDGKKAAEKAKALQKDLLTALLDLAKKAEAAEASLLTGENRIKKQQEISTEELNNLKKLIEEKGKLTNKNFKFTIEQEEQFAIIQKSINQETANALLQIEINKSNAIAAQRKKEVDDELKFLELKQSLATAQIEGAKNDTGLSEADFELAKQRVLLQIQSAAAKEQLDLKRATLLEEGNLKITAFENELRLLNTKNDSESNLKAEQIQENIEALKTALGLESQILTQETANQIDGFAKQINEIDKKLNVKPINLAELLGVTPDQLKQIQDALSNAVNEIGNALSASTELQQQQLDFELEANEKRIESSEELIEQRETELQTLEESLNSQYDLQQRGLANNVEFIQGQILAKQAQLADEKAINEKALAEEKRIKDSKKQLAIEQAKADTILQGINLITASTDIYKSLAPLGPPGIVTAVITIASMLSAFAIQKQKIFQSLNQGFKEGGYTGDKGTSEVAGQVHGKEFVMTADKTKKYRNLFEGIHTDNKPLIEQGIYDLLKGTKVSLPSSLDLANKKDSLRSAEFKAYLNNDNSIVEERLSSIESRFVELIKANKNSHIVLPDGTQIIKKGNSITKIKPKR